MSGTMHGVLLALTSAFLSASFSIINGKFAQRIDATIVSFYELFGGVLFLTVFLLFTNQFTAEFFNITLTDLMWLASICTAYAFIASVNVMKYISPYTVMLSINLEPVYGIALAVLIFDKNEQMSFSFYIGAAIILITVILNGLIRNYKKSS
jgi:drug/metabolite transporter (DMT)-like permease